jgi:hypothetical protein
LTSPIEMTGSTRTNSRKSVKNSPKLPISVNTSNRVGE